MGRATFRGLQSFLRRWPGELDHSTAFVHGYSETLIEIAPDVRISRRSHQSSLNPDRSFCFQPLRQVAPDEILEFENVLAVRVGQPLADFRLEAWGRNEIVLTVEAPQSSGD